MDRKDESLQRYVKFLEAKITKQQISLTMKDMVIAELVKRMPSEELDKIGEHIKIEAPKGEAA